MAKTIKTTFRLKRGDASVWATKNPVLDPGEPGFEIDTGKLKIGNGTSAWNDLAYLAGDGGGSAPAESESGVEFVNIEFDVENETEFTNITANKTNIDIYNILQEGKYIIAKAMPKEYPSPAYLPLVSAQLGESPSDSVFIFSGMVSTAVIWVNLTNDEIQIGQATLADEDEVDRLSDQLSSFQTTTSDLQSRVLTLEESSNEIEYINFRLDSNMNITSAPSESAYSIYKKQHNGKQMIAKIWQATGDGEGKIFYIPLIYVKEQEDIYVPYFTFNINNTFYTISAAGSYENYTSSTWTITSFFLPNETAFNTLSSTVSGLESTIANLPRGIRFLGKGEVLPPFEGGEIENGDIYLVGDKEYIAYNETWYELGDYGAYATQSDLTTLENEIDAKANAADLGDLAYRSLGAVSDSNTTSPPSGAAVKEAIDTATSEVGTFVENAINQAIIGAMNASY